MRFKEVEWLDQEETRAPESWFLSHCTGLWDVSWLLFQKVPLLT